MSEKGTTLSSRVRLKTCLPYSLPYVPSAPPSGAADLHLSGSPPPSVSIPLPPDAPSCCGPWSETPEPAEQVSPVGQGAAALALQMPLKETQGLQHIVPTGTHKRKELSSTTNHFPQLISTGSIIPFHTWKPQAPVDSSEFIFQDSLTHLGGLSAALLNLFNAEECQWVVTEARNGSRPMPQGVN